MKRQLRQLANNPGAVLEKSLYLLTHPWALVWHPHQGVWNGYISLLSLGLLKRPSIWVDTGIRCLSAWMKAAPDGAVARRARLVHVDIGLHAEARQAVLMIDWFGPDWDMLVLGYEAHPDLALRARETVDAAAARHAGVQARVMNLALVGPDHGGPVIDLFLDDKDGKGNSLLAERGARTVSVPAERLSAQLSEHGVDPSRDIVILRMNIEGAELFVLQDLEDAGLLHRIAGFYGMWNDLFKISPSRDAALRRFRRHHRLHPFPFNERDLVGRRNRGPVFRWREWAIRTHLDKTIRSRNAELSRGA